MIGKVFELYLILWFYKIFYVFIIFWMFGIWLVIIIVVGYLFFYLIVKDNVLVFWMSRVFVGIF